MPMVLRSRKSNRVPGNEDSDSGPGDVPRPDPSPRRKSTRVRRRPTKYESGSGSDSDSGLNLGSEARNEDAALDEAAPPHIQNCSILLNRLETDEMNRRSGIPKPTSRIPTFHKKSTTTTTDGAKPRTAEVKERFLPAPSVRSPFSEVTATVETASFTAHTAAPRVFSESYLTVSPRPALRRDRGLNQQLPDQSKSGSGSGSEEEEAAGESGVGTRAEGEEGESDREGERRWEESEGITEEQPPWNNKTLERQAKEFIVSSTEPESQSEEESEVLEIESLKPDEKQEKAEDTEGPSEAEPTSSETNAAPPVTKAAPPVTKAAPPGAKAAPPGAKAAPPETKAAPPETKAAPPETKAAPPETKAAPPEAKAAPPVTKAAPSETKAAPSETKAAPSETKAAPSETKAAPSETKAAPSETKAAPPGAKAAPSGAKAAPPETKAAPPETKAAPPETKAKKRSPRCCWLLLRLLLRLLLLLLFGGFTLHLWLYGPPRSVAQLSAQLHLHWLQGIVPAPCSSHCRVSLVESLPLGLYPSAPALHESIAQSWLRLLDRANHSVDVAAFYVTLRSPAHDPSDAQGRLVLEKLKSLRSKGVSLRVAVNAPQTQSDDTQELKDAGAEVTGVHLSDLTGGIIHTKLWAVDQTHMYVGSANMDWRSLTQVKELGVTVEDCSCLSMDAARIFEVYRTVGGAKGSLPLYWPARLSALSSAHNPLHLTFNGVPARVYLSSAPPQLSTRGRTQDLDAILSVIHDALQFVHVSVMDFLPLSQFSEPPRFWPPLDSALRSAACSRGLKVRLLVSCWSHSPSAMFVYLQSLLVLNRPPLNCDIRVKVFTVPSSEEQRKIPFARVNHAKFMVTDRVLYIGTSNWSEDYFTQTAGVGLVLNQTGSEPGLQTLRDQADQIFLRDWTSQYSTDLSVDQTEACPRDRD